MGVLGQRRPKPPGAEAAAPEDARRPRAASMAGRVVVKGVGAVNTVIGPERLVGAAMVYQGARAAKHDDDLAAAMIGVGATIFFARSSRQISSSSN